MSTPNGILTVNQTWPFWRGQAEGVPGAATGEPRTAEVAVPGRLPSWAAMGGRSRRGGLPVSLSLHTSLLNAADLNLVLEATGK